MPKLSALNSVNDASERGVRIRVLAQLDRRTIRFFSQLHEDVEVEYTKDLEAQGDNGFQRVNSISSHGRESCRER